MARRLQVREPTPIKPKCYGLRQKWFICQDGEEWGELVPLASILKEGFAIFDAESIFNEFRISTDPRHNVGAESICTAISWKSQ